MGDSAWDKQLRELLGQFYSDRNPSSWDQLAKDLDSLEESTPTHDVQENTGLRETLFDYRPEGQIEGWEKIASSLDAHDRMFDEKINQKFRQYEAPYDPHSWPVFFQKFTDNRLLRTKLILLKSFEFAAILLFLIAMINIGSFDRLPLEPSNENIPVENKPAAPGSQDKALYQPGSPSSDDGIASASLPSMPANNLAANLPAFFNSRSPIYQPAALPKKDIEFIASSNSFDAPTIFSLLTTIQPDQTKATSASIADSDVYPNEGYITSSLASTEPMMIASNKTGNIPDPTYVHTAAMPLLEFGILTQADYNLLRMPEDRLYSAGKQIVFPEKGIPSHGFGAGFTFAINHPVWALESGVIYTSKTFDPGRELTVGTEFNNGSVEFEAMRLQLVSIPLQFRFRFERQGRLKAYAFSGLGVHVIAESNIDVQIKYNFPTLSAGTNPGSDPYSAETIRESRRIREHIRDGAPFSTKSYTTLNAGLGLEYSLVPNTTLFFQTAFQYQVPNLKFSNNNGKHIRSLSLQAGVRMPLGS